MILLLCTTIIVCHVRSVKRDRQMDGWMDGIFCILFFSTLGASPMHVYLSFCLFIFLSIHPSIFLSAFSYGTQHIHTLIVMAKRDQMTPQDNRAVKVWTPVYTWNFKQMIAAQQLQLHLWKPQYCYNFRHVKSVCRLKLHPSESNKVTVISGFWNLCHTWNFTCQANIAFII